jgi:hypothetical protein
VPRVPQIDLRHDHVRRDIEIAGVPYGCGLTHNDKVRLLLDQDAQTFSNDVAVVHEHNLHRLVGSTDWSGEREIEAPGFSL